MPDIILQVLMGVLQGVAEWLPISSSGHLAAASLFFNIAQPLSYEVFLHIASLLVILIYFRTEILRLSKSALTLSSVHDRKLIFNIILATGVTVVVALLLKPLVDSVHDNAWMLAVAFLITSIVVGLSAFKNNHRNIQWYHAVLLGLVQGIAVIPGISRSGMTIGLALLLGIKRDEAFTFSFLAAIPVIIAAFIFIIPHFSFEPLYLVGFVVVLFVGYYSLALLDRVVKKGHFHVFSVYTVILALVLLLVERFNLFL